MQVQKRCSAQAKCEGPLPDCTAKREVRGTRRASFRPLLGCTAKREVRDHAGPVSDCIAVRERGDQEAPLSDCVAVWEVGGSLQLYWTLPLQPHHLSQ